MNQGKLNSHFLVQLETLKIYHNQGWTISYTDNQSESENNLILILKKDLLPTLEEVYQSCQLQSFKAYKYDRYDVLQK